MAREEINPSEPVENIIKNANIPAWQRGIAEAVNETYNYSNSSLFYGLLPAYYRDYAWRYLRPAVQWLSGYVPSLHQNGFSGVVSTRIATKLVTGFTKQVVGEKLVFKPVDKTYGPETQAALKKISRWYDDNNVFKAVYAGIGFALGLGTSLLKINKSINQELWWEAVRFDNCFYLADFKNEVKEATFLIRNYVDTRKDKSNQQFYLVEHRFWKYYEKPDMIKKLDGTYDVLHKKGEKVPMVEYQVYRVNGTTMNNTMPNITETGSLNWDNIPQEIRKQIKDNYAVLRINEPQELGLSNLGVFPLLNGEIDLSIPTGSNFGESMIVGIQDDLITYELACSYQIRDMYLGKGTVYMPKSLSLGDMLGSGDGGTYEDSVLQGVGDSKIENVTGLNPDKATITVQQFEIRVDQWQTAKENALKSIAVKWNMSPKILASFLANGAAQMTATQIDSEDDMSIATIYHTRSYFENALNAALETTLNFYGFTANIKVGFSSPSLLNKDRLLERINKEMEMGLIDIEDAIRDYFGDLDEDALQSKISKAKQLQAQMKMQQMTEMNPDGSFGVPSELNGEQLDGSTFNYQ